MSTDAFIINGIFEQRGPEAARHYAQQTLRVYRRAVLNSGHFASSTPYRRVFIMSYQFYKHYLRQSVSPPNTGGTPNQPVENGKRAGKEEKRERYIDDALDGSFPASDPPPWTLGGCLHNHYVAH